MHRLRQGRARGPTLNPRGAALALAVAALIVGVDQLSKAWILRHVTPGIHHVLGPLDVELGRNQGAAFSVLSSHSLAAALAALALTCAVGVCAVRSVPVAASVVLGLLLGGGLSNLADRVARRSSGGVVDFLKLPHWPAFNVADTAITFGIVGLTVMLIAQRPVLAKVGSRDAPR